MNKSPDQRRGCVPAAEAQDGKVIKTREYYAKVYRNIKRYHDMREIEYPK